MKTVSLVFIASLWFTSLAMGQQTDDKKTSAESTVNTSDNKEVKSVPSTQKKGKPLKITSSARQSPQGNQPLAPGKRVPPRNKPKVNAKPSGK